MKQLLFALTVATSACAFALTVPQVSSPSLSRTPENNMRVTYSLNTPAIVTAKFFADGVEVPEASCTMLSGAVNRIVDPAADTLAFVWNCTEEWPGHSGENMTAELTAWPVYFPPQYCCVDVSGGTSATSFPVTYYVSSNAVPGGVTNDIYKTSRILLRKIDRTDSGGFAMGSAYWEGNHVNEREGQHTVVLTRDYYIGVYEVTVAQWRLVKGTDLEPNNQSDDRCPMEKVAYSDWRGARPAIDFPNTGKRVDASSFMGVLRTKTGNIYPFDLPTDAQWERAARADNRESFIDGSSMSRVNTQESLPKIANVSNSVGHTTPVGSYIPSAWGLYDLHGNVFEWCCDWRIHGAWLPDGIDPVGSTTVPSDGAYRIARGGSYMNAYDNARFAHRNANSENARIYSHFGARLCATIEQVEE